ncbi:hypothetical protein ASG12_04170 [Williamsia sp. Leaf354]|uniref:SRPBCC family protein n=1 Tax=Williamsia sp. Leaf354 TaxID=1736349 RepID=UPI0006F59A59|nr:SRPBCC family protein [Williamsia sp. Leaf354]KQR99958.1 hypothetical protein ASG12_04170 [Williamsia sp. Leaf354]
MAEHQLQPIDDVSFFHRAPVAYRFTVDLPVTPDVAWAELTRQNTLDWCRMIKKVTFTSPEPHGVGTTRTAELAPGLVKINERFFVWEADAEAGTYRNAFTVVSANVPGLRRFGELTEVVPSGLGSRLTWAFAIEPAGPLAKLPGLSVVSKPALGTFRTDTVKHFAKLA